MTVNHKKIYLKFLILASQITEKINPKNISIWNTNNLHLHCSPQKCLFFLLTYLQPVSFFYHAKRHFTLHMYIRKIWKWLGLAANKTQHTKKRQYSFQIICATVFLECDYIKMIKKRKNEERQTEVNINFLLCSYRNNHNVDMNILHKTETVQRKFNKKSI